LEVQKRIQEEKEKSR